MFSFEQVHILRTALVVSAAVVLASCEEPRPTKGAGTPVPVSGETQSVATQTEDAADDPEIWVDPADPSRVLIVGTDKQAGLYSYTLDGKQRGFIPDGKLNNVDLRDGLMTPQGPRVLVAASDRGRMGVALYQLDPATLDIAPWQVVALDLTEPYGLCAGRRGDDVLVFVNSTDGQVRQLKIEAREDGKAVVTEERRFAIPSQPEGCVVDDVKGVLYIGEEAKGIWRYDLAAAGAATGTIVAPAPSDVLKPDVEGMTLLREGPVTWLIASSQGDSAFAVWRVDGETPDYRGRFSAVAANGVDAVTGTDGVAGHGGAVGPYPEGLLVMQDDVDTAGEAVSDKRARQNFKFVDWREVKKALALQP